MATSAETRPTLAGYDSADPDARPPWRIAVPLGLQHVLAMFTSNLTPAILLAGVIGAGTGQATLLVQAALLCAGLATLLQTIGIGPVGSRLPLMMGAAFAFIAVAVPLAEDFRVALGRGIASAPAALERVTGDWSALFESGIVVAAVVAVVLDLVLPGRVRPAPLG
jgi:xanthine/uracil permease